MTILVCPLSKVTATVAARAPERIVSLLDPDYVFPDLGSSYADRHLKLAFHDAHIAGPDEIVPSVQHAREFVEFVRNWPQSAPILIHCRAGIGRSTAAAFITACVKNPGVDELAIARALRAASPLARPNQTLVELADAVLGRSGRMERAITETGRGLGWADVEATLRVLGEGVAFEMTSRF
jgi:predicted protein tyrosine phosphatase